jgi:hypothetical protein
MAEVGRIPETPPGCRRGLGLAASGESPPNSLDWTTLTVGFSGPVEPLSPVLSRKTDDAIVQTWPVRALHGITGNQIRVIGLENTRSDALLLGLTARFPEIQNDSANSVHLNSHFAQAEFSFRCQ